MKISVVIPFYNAERTLNAAIDSVLAQKMDKQLWRDIEVLLIDDGSLDKSYDIAKSCSTYQKVFNLEIFKFYWFHAPGFQTPIA